MRYELWRHTGEGTSYTLLAADSNSYAANRTILETSEPGSECILVIEAESWDAAHQKRNEFLGWGPYRPASSTG